MRSLDNLGGPRFRQGLTLMEVLVALAICSLLMVVLLSLWLFGSRSFVAIANYQDLDAKSRHALDIMSLEIRQATQVLGFQSSGSDRWLVLTNEAKNLGLKYNWDAASRTLTGQKTGRSPEVYLTECDAWQFELYQRTPRQNTTNLFFPATNVFGSYDPAIVKLIDMSWKCSRTILGQKVNTESVQTAQIVLRNKY